MGYERYDKEGYDDDFFRVLATRVLAPLWRRTYFVAAFCAVGVFVAGLVAISKANQYTWEFVLQARFTQEDRARSTAPFRDIFNEPSTLSVVQTEVSLIRSGDIAERGVPASIWPRTPTLLSLSARPSNAPELFAP